MGCCGKEFDTGNCVCDILKEIADVQNDIVENCCDSSCERSINDLLGEQENNNDLDTVPVLLYCQDGCKPFKGFGAFRGDNNGSCDFGEVVGSFYFRVKKVDDNCCAVLELLRDPADDDCNPENPVDQDTCHLRATGICITVDVNCFCHVTCLPAISAFNTVVSPSHKY
ncbi:spore coat protein [Virgibacillus dakarensis]|uniref:Spore coat protein Y n=1 Tax=Lentibacillus populi TaxID=1827502 RepID=A0A9W5TXW7_9BACI|nr:MULTISPECIES: CotY/CotZ family spore coat protein [Bacillaceae]MBT2215455.1 spore coat protein [Virgibacillus dakarensis]MTW87229.1 spore coat protein [Virgibacillus dakarensis]GGB40335.1 spore coat protein Y [Lentibacillus populi]